MIVQCAKCQQHYEVGNSTGSVCPQCQIPLMSAPGNVVPVQDDGWDRKGFLKFLGIIIAAVVVVSAVFTGYMFFWRGGSALDYVPEKADFVVYGNTEMLLNSKTWKYSMQIREFREFVNEFKDEFDLDDIEDLEGSFAVWGKIPNGPFSAVIVLDNGNAEDIYEMLLKKSEDESNSRVEEDEVDGCKVFTVYDGDQVEVSVALVDDDVLQLAFGNEIDEIVEADGDNEMARAIDRDAVFAVAGSKDLWSKLETWARGEGVNGVDFDGLGIVKLEVFADDDEVRIVVSSDISDIEVDD